MNIKELLEQFNNFLYETKEQAIYLYEMSTPLGKVKDKIHDLSSEIADHLIKIILYGKEESRTLHHLCHEINNWLNVCVKNKIKRQGKDSSPTEKELYTWLTDYYSDASDMTGIRRVWENEYTYQGHTSRDHISDEEVYNSFISILKELCYETARNTNTDDKVQEIVEKYILG